MEILGPPIRRIRRLRPREVRPMPAVTQLVTGEARESGLICLLFRTVWVPRSQSAHFQENETLALSFLIYKMGIITSGYFERTQETKK